MNASRNKAKNPFEDILVSTKDHEKPSLEHLDAVLREEGVTEIRSYSNDSALDSISEIPIVVDEELSPVQREVDQLVQKLKSLVGDFDTADLQEKVKLKSKENNRLSRSNSEFEQRFPRSNSGTERRFPRSNSEAETSVFTPRRKASNFPVMQKQPFNSSERLSPASMISTDLETRQSSSRLTSNRYSVGLNIFSQTKNIAMDIAKAWTQATGSPRAGRETILSIPLNHEATATKSFKQTPGEPVHDTQPLPELKPSSTIEGFMEFSVISVDPDYLTGKKKLLKSNYQPVSFINRFPHERKPIVDNLSEYIFPFGSKLQILRLSDWKRKKKSIQYETKYQIMQFTDETNHIYHSYCIILYERIPASNPSLIRNLEFIHAMSLASDVIKRAIRNYIFRKNHFPRFNSHNVSFRWKENIKNSRPPSLADNPNVDLTNESAPNISPKKNKSQSGTGLKYFMKALKSQFTGKKDPSEKKRLSQSALTAKNIKESWKFSLKSKKKKGTLSTMSSESSSSVVSNQYHTDDGIGHPLNISDNNGALARGAVALNAPSPMRTSLGYFDRASLDSNTTPMTEPIAGDCENRVSSVKRTHSVWAALENSNERKSLPGMTVSPSSPSEYENPYQFFLRNNPIGSPLSPGKLKRADSVSDSYSETSSRRTDKSRPLKQLKSVRSFNLLNKKVVVCQKALCFLTELPMPSVFFRVRPLNHSLILL
jgi:hypothetical protein